MVGWLVGWSVGWSHACLLACLPACLLACLLACFAWARVVSLRRSDEVDIVGAQTLMLEQGKGPRTCVRAEFSKTGASTPGQTEGHFIVTLNHTRSGSVKSGMKITADNPVQFNQDRRGAGI